MKASAKIIVLLIAVVSNIAFAQKEGNIWYFGDYAGLDFNSGSPVPLTNSSLITEEGSATICDKYGNLLFYTDGVTVWNRNHNVMSNGTGLLGHSSSTQSGVIVPKPGYPNIYYVFTVSDKTENNGFRFSIVDMSLDGGNGAVTTKNQLLFTPCVEKITAVKHANNVDIWVIGHKWESNQFYTYLITTNGINTIENAVPGFPIIATQGSWHADDSYNCIGYLKASSNGDKIACAVYGGGWFELFDFNSTTGAISYIMQFSGANYVWAYGVEFSPDGKLLYLSKMEDPARIYQYDITLPTPAAILASRYLVASSPGNFSYAALQLAPDRKIYVARYGLQSLSVINSPNSPGSACNFVDDQRTLAGRYSRWGLPCFIQTYFGFNFNISSNSPLCPNDTLFLYCDTVSGGTYYWYGPNGFTSTQQNPKIVNATSVNEGWYYCEVTLMGLTKKDSLFVTINDRPNANAGPDKKKCPLASVTIGQQATGGTSPYTYLWSPPTGLSSTTVYNPSTTTATDAQYIVRVTDDNGCVDYDTILVTIIVPQIDFPDGDTLDFGMVCTNTPKDSIFRIRNASGFPTTFTVDDSKLGSRFTVTGTIDDRQFLTNETRSLAVRFNSSTVTGKFLDSVRIVDTCGNYRTFFLKMQVANYDFTLAPDTLDFGTFCKNESKDSSFTVRNISGFKTTFTCNSSFLHSFYNVDKTPFNTQFNNNEQRTIDISFTGHNVNGQYLDSLWVIDSCGNHRTLYLKVEIASPQIAALPDTLNFGNFCLSMSKEMSFILKNLSGYSTKFTGEILPSPNPHFEFTDNSFFFDYLVDEQRTITVRFMGGGFDGVYIDSLRITDECGKTYKIILKASIGHVSIDYFPDSLTICHNTDTTRIRYIFSGGTAPYTYNWVPSTGLNDSHIAQPTITDPTDITYYLTITDKYGCSATDSVEVKAIPPPDLTFQPNPLNFGLLDSCESQKELTLRITNNGSESVTLTDSSVNSSYTVIGTHVRTIGAGEYTDVTVRVTRNKGKSGDSINGRLIFRSQACGDVYFVDLKAMIKGETIAISTAGIDFGTITDCDNKEYEKTITIYNLNKSLTAEIGQPQFLPADNSYTIVSPTSFPRIIPSLDSLVVTLRFKPTSPGAHISQLAFPFTIGECISILSVNLAGIQTKTELTVAPSDLDFGELTGCQDSISRTVVLTNTGITTITSISAVCDENIEIDSMDLDVGTGLMPKEYRRVKITFKPSSNGQFNGTVIFRYKPCDKEVAVTYSGAKFGINFTAADTVDFGNICYYENAVFKKTFTIKNISEGGQDGSIKDFRVAGDFSRTGIMSLDMKLADKLENGVARTYEITFTPDKPGRFIGSLDIMFSPCDITKKIVLVANLPRLSIKDMPESITLCHNIDTAVIRYTVNSDAQLEYEWSPRTGLSAYDVKEPVITEPSDVTYTVIVRDEYNCSATASVKVHVLPEPDLSFLPPALDLGTMDSCETQLEKDLVITNNGTSSVTLESTIDNKAFAILGSNTVTIPPKGSVTLKVRFIRFSSDDTLQTGTITFLSSECGDVFEVKLTAKVKGKLVSVSSPEIDFGDVVDCDFNNKTRTVTITNTNTNLEVVLDSYSFNPSIEPLTLTEPVTFPVTIAPGRSVTLAFRFDPQDFVECNVECKIPFAMGVCSDTINLKIYGRYVVAKLEADKQSIQFADLTGCQNVDSTTIVLTNTGSSLIDSIYAVHDDNIILPDSSLVLNEPLKPGESRTVTVYFKPNKNGSIAGKIEFTYLPCNRKINVDYTGNKFGTNFSVTESVDFGQITLCQEKSKTATITIANISEGSQDGFISTITPSGTEDFDISSIQAGSLNPGETRTYTIGFAPQSSGKFDGTVEILFQPCDIAKTIRLTGSAVNVGFTASPRLIEDSILKTGSVERVARFTNTGTARINVSGIIKPKDPITITEISPHLPAVLDPGEEIAITMKCAAGDQNSYSDVLVLYGDDPCTFTDSVAIDIKILDYASSMDVFIKCPADSAPAGSTTHIPVYYRRTENLVTNNEEKEFEISLMFNNSLMYPIDEDIINSEIVDNIHTITLRKKSSMAETEGTLCVIPFIAALGDAKISGIEITEFKWIDATYTVSSVEDGCFYLSGICPDYGDRLLDPDSRVSIKSIYPNPSNGKVNILFELCEKGYTKMTIVNVYGEEILTVFEGEPNTGETTQTIDSRSLAAGSYFIILQTPTVTRVNKLEVVR